MVDKLNDRAIVFNRMANEYKLTHNALDANFVKAMDYYAEDHPMFGPGNDLYDPLLGTINPKYLKPETPAGGASAPGGPTSPAPKGAAPGTPDSEGWITRPDGIRIKKKSSP